MSFNFCVFLFIILQTTFEKSIASNTSKRPNIYRWLAQNSYICDPTLLNKRSHRFLTPKESSRIRCSCGDPLVTKSACGRKGAKDKPKCFKLPDACLHEYTVIFANGGNRMSPNPHRPFFRTIIKKRPVTPRRPPKIFGIQPVNTILRVRKPKS